MLSSETRDKSHEVSSRGVGDQKAKRKFVGEQFEVDLGSAGLAHEAGSANSALLESLDAVEAAACWLSILIEGASWTEGKDLSLERRDKAAWADLKAGGSYQDVAGQGLLEELL